MNIRITSLALAAAITSITSITSVARAQENMCNPPHVDEMERLMEDYVAAFNSQDPAQFGRVLTDDYYTQNPLGVFEGLATMQYLMTGVYASLQGIHYEIERVVVYGNEVVLEYTYTATHAGEFLGIPATGTVVHGRGMEVHRIRGGKIAATWNYSDIFGLLAQLGAF